MTDSNGITRVVDGVEVPVPGKYVIDPSHSTVGFTVKHMMFSKVRGSFKQFTAEINIAENVEDSSVSATIQMESIDTGDSQRDNHLRSGDFFAIDQYPEMTYSGNKVTKSGGNWVLDGELSIHGVTKSVPLTLEFTGSGVDPYGNQRVGFSASTEINREDFGLTTNVVLEAGGIMIGKDIKIEIELEAIKQ